MNLEENKDITKKLEKEQKKELKQKEKAEKKKNKAPMDPAKKKKIIKRSIVGGVAGVFVLFILISNIAAANTKPVVTTAQVYKGDIEQTLSTSGTVTSGEVKTYFAPVSVKVGDIQVAAGETVQKGAPIITYDESALANEKRTAELKLQANEGSYNSSVLKNNKNIGDLGEANVNLDVLEQQITDIDNYIKELQQKVNDKKAALAYEGSLLQISLIDWADKPDSDEYQNLQKLIQMNTYEQTNNKDIRAWQDEITKYTDMLNNCKEYKAEMKSQKNSADGTVLNAGGKEELEANNEMQKISSQKTLDSIKEVENGVLADFNGVITEMNVVEGSTPEVGAQLFKLESTEDVKVTISVTKYDLEKLAIGQKAVVTIAGNKYDGEVSKINKMATKNNSGAAVVSADIKILNPDENIVLGVEAKISVNTANAKQTLIVPSGAVNTDVDGTFVYAVENGIVVRKPVQTGISSGMDIEIKEGLKEGDQVMTEVSTAIAEGMEVTAVPEATGMTEAPVE
ncbi:MAG: efflux RND transporter periplasmic adaptor subunit [Clostridiales bacterium]|nr:efflux RND transporter periplasmic adaptor subunit [Clostridiales bacterium]